LDKNNLIWVHVGRISGAWLVIGGSGFDSLLESDQKTSKVGINSFRA